MTATTCAAPAISVARYPADAVPAPTVSRLLELTLPNGDMAKVFAACANPRRAWTGQVVTATVGGEIVGWALRWKSFPDHRTWCVHLFVDPAHRRRGVGTALVAACQHRLRAETPVRGFVWDDASAAFWAATATGRVTAPDCRR